mmetsp:Transcript_5659/g.16824  ORF Transcript_5659/g.16824 Transcript_5659/m.16824 type:complete len:547 (+) Transcript_5659:370-2010(+)
MDGLRSVVPMRQPHTPRGIVFSQRHVGIDGEFGEGFLLETYAEQSEVPNDLVAETVIKFVWTPESSVRQQMSLPLEDVITAIVKGDSIVLVEKGLRNTVVLQFSGENSTQRFFKGLERAVPLYNLGEDSKTYAVESTREIRRVKRSIIEMDDYVSSNLTPNGSRLPTLHLLRGFAMLTSGVRNAVDALNRKENGLFDVNDYDLDDDEADGEIIPPYPISRSRKRGVPVTASAWNMFMQHDSPIDSITVRHAIFLGGIEPNLREKIWPYIAGVYSWDIRDPAQLAEVDAKIEEEYKELLAQWIDRKEELDNRDEAGEDPETDFARLKVDRGRVLKDVTRTDREVDMFSAEDSPALDAMQNILTTYAVYDRKIGYCQGMSDILAPIVYVFGPDREACCFKTFAKLMTKLERNFRIDQTGIQDQLKLLKELVEASDSELADYFNEYDPNYYSCFRWILVQLKRELPFRDVLRLWEVLWLEHLEENFQVYIVVGLLRMHKLNLLRLGGFDDLVRYINRMSMRIDVDTAIEDAVDLFKQVGPLPKNKVKEP